jgi:uncharacterized protein (DUF2141 family)
MKFAKLAALTLSVWSLIPALAFAEATSLAVNVKNLPSTTGTVEVSLFNSEEMYLKEPYRQQSGSVGEDGTYSTVFTDLAAGEYAVVVVHDENDNGTLDSGFLGFGGESYGFSNNVFSLFGRPGFDAVKIIAGPEGATVEIDLD